MLDNNDYRTVGLNEIQNLYYSLFPILEAFLIQHNIKYWAIAGTVLGAVRHEGFIPWDEDIDLGMDRENYEKFLFVSKKLNNKYFYIENYRYTKHVAHALTRVCFKGTYLVNDTLSDKYDHAFHIDIFPLDFVPLTTLNQKEQEKKLLFLKNKLYYKTVAYHGGIIKRFGLFLVKSLLVFSSSCKITKKMDYIASKKYTNQVDGHIICSMMSQYSYKKQSINVDIYGIPVRCKFGQINILVPEKTTNYLEKLYGNNFMTPMKRHEEEKIVGYIRKDLLS